LRQRRMRLDRERGQTLVLIAIAMPLFLAVIALVTDGSMLLVHRRSLQVAADAASLAAAQEITSDTCDAACVNRVEHAAGEYSDKNGGPSVTDPGDGSRMLPVCASASKTNCVAVPYVDKSGVTHARQVEVRLTKTSAAFFTRAVGLKSLFDVSARAVGGTNFDVAPDTVSSSVRTGTTDPGSTITNTSTSTSTVTTGGEGAVAFTLSSDCPGAPATATVPAGAAIQWTGSQSTLKSLVTNGGISVSGNAGKSANHIALGKYAVASCRDFYGSPNPDPAAFPDVRNLPGAPIPYPVPPPNPAPPAGCLPVKPAPNNVDFTIDASWLTTHPPGVYCLTGSTALLTVGANGATFNGYTFFAPRITLSSNGMTFTNAPPASGQPPTVFDAYGTDATSKGVDTCAAGKPTSCAFSISGNSNTITGDIFAPNGTINLSGGGASTGNGGEGFMESLKLLVSGNFANFNGTGPTVGGTTTTVTSTTTSTTTIPGFTDPGTTVVTTIPGGTTGTTYGLDE
jgi:Flp pilus assembly protein TadG